MPSVRDFLGFVVNPPPGDPSLTAQSDLLPKGAVLIPPGMGAPSGSVPVADGTGGYVWQAGPPPAGAVTVPPGSGAAAGTVPTADGTGGYVWHPPIAPLTGAAWIAPTLTSSWANSGGGLETVGYLKDPLGFVHLKGVMIGGTNLSVPFVLPAGFRPGATTQHPIGAGIPMTGSGAVCQIAATGVATIINIGASSVGLSGITFLAEN